jgi:hypothetical protein
MANAPQSPQNKPEGFGTGGSRFGTEGMGQAHQGTVAEKARDVASSVTGKAQEFASSMAQKAEDIGSNVGRQAQQAWESGRRYVQEQGVSGMADDLTELIRRNPIPALLVGFGLGFLVARRFHPYFRWHSADDTFRATIRPLLTFSPSGSTYTRLGVFGFSALYPMTWMLKIKAVSVSALNQCTLSLWSETVEHSPGAKTRSMVGRTR